MMLSLERAVRVFRALVESPVKVDSSTVVSWSHLDRALSHDPVLLNEMRDLSPTERTRVQAYVGEFAPLQESRPVYVFPTARDASRFIQEVTDAGGNATHLDGGGLVAASGNDFSHVESAAAQHNGVAYSGPSLSDHYEYVDRQLPEALFIDSGLDPATCESALIFSLKSGHSAQLQESMLAGIQSDGPLASFQTRIDTFARPKMVLGVPAALAEAVRMSGYATPQMLKLMEAGNAVVPGGDANAQAADRGGVAQNQSASDSGSPANSRTSEQQPQQPPTEHVPTQEQGGATNAIKLPDGTEVPFDAMKQAFAKMLHNMAAQVENGTLGGQAAPRGAGEADATGQQPPQPSVAQQQVATQSASQQAAGNGAEPPAQPAQANGEQAAPPAPPAAEAPPAAPAQPGAEAAHAAEAPPAGDPAVDATLTKAEQGDQEALKQAQGMQGQMSDEQKQRLQQLLAAQAGGSQPAQESYLREASYSKKARDVISAEMSAQKNKKGLTQSQKVGRAIGVAKSKGLKVPPRPKNESTLQENLRDALRMLVSANENTMLSGIYKVIETDLSTQPSKLVERVLDQLNVLAAHTSGKIREAALSALGSLYEATTAPTRRDSTINKAKSLGEKRTAYVKRHSDACTVWTRANVTAAATLPEGLEYQGGGCAPGAHVVLVEEGPDTSLVRTLDGDTVRVANHHLKVESFSGFVNGKLVESAELASIIEAAQGRDMVLVVGQPHSGKGHFINASIGPCVSEGVEFPYQLSVDAPWGDMQERAAREDFETLLREANGEQERFDRTLMSPRFRYVSESGHAFLRDAVSWQQFRRCGVAASRNGVDEGFGRFFSQANVRDYYANMQGDARAATARVFKDRVSEAVIELGESVIVDCTPETNVMEFVQLASRANMHVHLVEFITPLKLSLARTTLRESVVRRNSNLVSAGVDEALRSGGVDRHTRYIWDGDEATGRFTAVEGKIEDKQAVVLKKKNIDGDNPGKPKMRKDIAVRESFGGPFTPAQREQNVEDFKQLFPTHAHLVEELDTGQASESESCASGMQEAGKLLSDARAAIFKLTTSSLVQCASMAQATGMNKTKGLLDKVQQQGASFLDELKGMGDLLQKANESMKSENGGMGGDNVDAVKQQAAAMAGGAAPAPASPVDATVPAPADPAVSEAIGKVLGTKFMDAIKQGEHYRALNESLTSYCPMLDVRQRTQVIDRLKAMTMLPEDASLRVAFSRADHRILSESATYGSVVSGLATRTASGRNTLASLNELQEAIKALRVRGGGAQLHLADSLERAITRERLVEDRARATAWGGAFSDAGPFRLNVAKIGVKQAIEHAESVYDRFGMDVYDDLPNLARNFTLLKQKMSFALPIPRQEMPVIEPKKGDIEAFANDLRAGRVDIFEPWASEHMGNLFPWERSGSPRLGVGDDSWITLGVKDGDQDDDKLPVGSVKPISVKKLKPLQDQIWFDKLIATIIAFGPPAAGSFVTTKGVAIVSSDDYILDGHHRFGQIMLADPSLPMQGLVIPVKRDKLLSITRSYGTARGNRAKA
jgi:predicted kinase